MNSDYLSKESDCLYFVSREEFYSTIENLDLSVPARDRGRKSFHRERFCAIRYLKAAVHFKQIDFPFSIYKSECPDFIINLNNVKTIGLEHRDITTEETQESLAYVNKRLREEHFILEDLPNSDLDQNQTNNEWARLALIAVPDKIDKLNGPNYQKLDSYELLLYSNTDLPNVVEGEAISILSAEFNKKYCSVNLERLYNSLTIIYGDEVWFQRLNFSKAS